MKGYTHQIFPNETQNYQHVILKALDAGTQI